MLAYLIGLLSGDIEVEISPDSFAFRRKGQTNNFRAIICISADGRPRVLGVGHEHIPTEPHFKIELFKPDEPGVASFDKTGCLYALFRYCIRKKINRTARWIKDPYRKERENIMRDVEDVHGRLPGC